MIRRRRAKKRRRARRIFLLIVVLAILEICDSNIRITTDEYNIASAKIPAELSSLRIVQLSDLHAAFDGRMNYLVSKVEETRPDIIAVTGDLIDDASQLTYVSELVPQLTKIAPVYYVTGNHEWATGVIHELFAMLTDMGVNVLRNDYDLVKRGGAEIILAGIDDPNGPADMEKPAEFVNRVRSEAGDKFLLLLAHRNDWQEKYPTLDVDCVLSGHAHGGLVRLPFTDGLVSTRKELFPSYTSGLYSENGTDLIVSRGLGNTDGTFRLFNNPHIPIIILDKK